MNPVRDIANNNNKKAVAICIYMGNNYKLTWHGCDPVRSPACLKGMAGRRHNYGVLLLTGRNLSLTG